MNDKIKTLFKQSMETSHFKSEHTGKDISIIGCNHEKFAELIIKACANAADMAADAGCDCIGDYIVEYFDLGVHESAANWREIK